MTGRLSGVRTPKQLTILLFSLLILPNCSRKKDKTWLLFQSLEKSFNNSNSLLIENTNRMITDLEQYRFDPTTSERVKYWLPKAATIHVLSKSIVGYMEQLKNELRNEASLCGNDTISCENATTILFQKKGKARELLANIIEYKNIVRKVDPALQAYLDDSEDLKEWYYDTSSDKTGDFIEQFFDHVSVSATTAVLSKLQNDIMLSENKLIRFCKNRCSYRGEGTFPSYTAIIAQNSTCVTTGETIEIIAGIGAFTKAALPLITIDGKITPIQSGGAAIYRFKTLNKPGKYSLPVSISFKDEEGRDQKITKDINYTVVDQPN